MSRLQQKCLFASMATHGLLLSLLFFGAAFVSPHTPPPAPVLTFIPSKEVDAALFSGGSPAAPPAAAGSPPPPVVVEAPPPPVAPPPVPEVSAPAPEPPRAEPVVQTPPPEPSTPKVAKDGIEPIKKPKASKTPPRDDVSDRKADKNSKPTDEKAPRSKIEPVLVESKEVTSRLKAQSKAAVDARARHDAQVARQQAFARAAEQVTGKVGSGLSSGTSIEMPPGPGGEAFADYRLIVRAKYERAWIPPGELDKESAVVQARVTIRRDGTVADARITKPSGDRSLDRSVERALQMKFVHPFPDEAKDSERSFLINFDLKTKRLLG